MYWIIDFFFSYGIKLTLKMEKAKDKTQLVE